MISKQDIADKQCWMVATTDTLGRLVITTIQNVAFGLCSSDRFAVIDPTIQDEKLDRIAPLRDGFTIPMYPVICARFYNKIHPQGFSNDSKTLIAIGSSRDVILYEVGKEMWKRKLVVPRPRMYPSENMGGIVSFANEPPCITWGYGRTPCFKDRTYALMAISWGPLIQLVILNELDQENGLEFFFDGYYIVAPGTVFADPENGQTTDMKIVGMKFLAESLLYVFTSTNDIRVLYT